jgi:hypothetical protein
MTEPKRELQAVLDEIHSPGSAGRVDAVRKYLRLVSFSLDLYRCPSLGAMNLDRWSPQDSGGDNPESVNGMTLAQRLQDFV